LIETTADPAIPAGGARPRYRLLEAETGPRTASHGGDAGRVILLDLGLPDLDGIEVTRRLREWSTVPIVVVSARGQERDKVEALDAGADDYLTKPFGTEELLARMRVALRHAARVKGDDGETVFETASPVDLGTSRLPPGRRCG
jgi:two-component system KDP operon response regulator KdpE